MRLLPLFLFLCLPITGYSQIRYLNAGNGDRFAQTEKDSFEITVEISGSIPNFFVANQNTYVQFGEQVRGLRIYRNSQEVHHNPDVYTLSNKVYSVKVSNNTLYRDNQKIYTFEESDFFQIGTWKSAGVFKTNWNGFTFSDGWRALAQLDTLYAVDKTLKILWDASTGSDGYIVQVVANGLMVESKTSVETYVDFKITGEGVYYAEVAAFDSTSTSAFAQSKKYFVRFDQTDKNPYDITGDNVVDEHDINVMYAVFLKCEGDISYQANADFNKDGCIDGRDLNILVAAWK